MVRVVLNRKDGISEDQIIVDLLIDGDGSVVGPFPAFGRVGDFNRPDTLYPFTLMGDGRMDYGAHADDSARHDKLDIRTAKAVAGAEISRATTVRTDLFVIDAVTPLASS